MQRAAGADKSPSAAEGGGSGSDATAAAASARMTDEEVATAVAPLLQLEAAGDAAALRMRNARSLELSERALAAAEASLPRDSLVTAWLLHRVMSARLLEPLSAVLATPSRADQLSLAAWRADAVAMRLATQRLSLLHARWRAGSLFTHTPEERAFFREEHLAGVSVGAAFYFGAANDMVRYGELLRTTTEREAAIRAIAGALRALLEWDARGYITEDAVVQWRAQVFADTLKGVTVPEALFTLRPLLSASLDSTGGVLSYLRTPGGFTREEEAELRRLFQRLTMVDDNGRQCGASLIAAAQLMNQQAHEAAAADVARHGLRACALPGCGAVEPHAKAFKLCSRCRDAVYCGAAHQREDWRRHKRDDGCKAPA
jgi:hypothetical protein